MRYQSKEFNSLSGNFIQQEKYFFIKNTQKNYRVKEVLRVSVLYIKNDKFQAKIKFYNLTECKKR